MNFFKKKQFFSDVPLFINFVLLLVFSFLLRIFYLDSIPGFNGDEAWHGMQAFNFLSGEPVSWMAPTGRLSSPFYFLTALFTQLLPTSLLSLRVGAVFSGVGLIILSFILVSRIYGKEVALLATALIACLPVNIAYSRLGIEASQIAFGSLLIFYFLLSGKKIPLLVSFVVAILLHPTNILLLPLGVAYLSADIFTDPKKDEEERYREVLWLLGISLVLVVAVILYVPRRYTDPALIWQLTSLGTLPSFFENFLRVISGANVYAEFSKKIPIIPQAIFDALTFLFVVATLGWGAFRSYSKRDFKTLSLVGGLGGSLFGLWVVGGVPAVREVERYSLFMVVPLCILTAKFLCDLAREKAAYRRYFFWGAGAYCWMILSGFTFFYFKPFLTGTSEAPIYRTGKEEPKVSAIEFALREMAKNAQSNEPIGVLLTGDWNTYWPARYLTRDYPRVEVLGFLKDIYRVGALQEVLNHPAYMVDSELGFLHHAISVTFSQVPGESQVFPDEAGDAVTRVFSLSPYGNLVSLVGRTLPQDNSPEAYQRLVATTRPLLGFFNEAGIYNLATGNLEAAILSLQYALKESPRVVPIRSNLGVAFARLGEKETAAKHFLEALAIDPSFLVAYEALISLDKNKKILKDIPLLSSNPEKFAKILKRVANVQFTKKEYKKAIQIFEDVLLIHPNDPVTLNNLGATWLALKKPEKARKYFKESLKYDPNEFSARQNLMALDQSTKRTETKK